MSETAKHSVGDELYFISSADRQFPAFIPSGKVIVTRVVDHCIETPYSPRFSYVVQVPSIPAATQGTDDRELYEIGAVPADERFWETKQTAVCADCGKAVAYANTKIVSEPVKREGKVYPGMATSVERRVCAHH
jgi:hypothetical protein